MKMPVLAVDLGGSHARCAVVEQSKILAETECAIYNLGFDEVLIAIQSALHALCSRLGIEPADTGGLAFGFPGIVDFKQTRVVSTNKKFDEARDFDFNGWSRRSFGVRLALENDARLALIGEHGYGAARHAEDAVLVTLGTGIGAAAMLGSRPLRGRHGHAGCLGGHLPVVLNGRRCTCGNMGCAEAEASTWALGQICSEWPGFASSELSHCPRIDFLSLFVCLDRGDRVAAEVFAHCCEVWSALTVGLIHAYAPEVVLFGGSVMTRAEEILPFVRQYVARHAWVGQDQVKIACTQFGSSSALHGAVPLLLEAAD